MPRPGTGSGRTARRGPKRSGPATPALRSCVVSSATMAWRTRAMGWPRTAPRRRHIALELATVLLHWVGPGDLAEALALFETLSARRLAGDWDNTIAPGLDAKYEVRRAWTAPSGRDVPRALDGRAPGLWRSNFVGRRTDEAFCIAGGD